MSLYQGEKNAIKSIQSSAEIILATDYVDKKAIEYEEANRMEVTQKAAAVPFFIVNLYSSYNR